MSTIPLTDRQSFERPVGQASTSILVPVLACFRELGSLKIAVVTFALAIVLILIGTLAQVNRDIWEVLETYFKVWFTWVDAAVFFPTSWFPQLEPEQATRRLVLATFGASGISAALLWSNASVVRTARPLALVILFCGALLGISLQWKQGFIFPGGALIGAVMGINLLAAHLTRYRVQARGTRLTAGLLISLVGLLITWFVIASGHNPDGFQGEPPIAWSTMWEFVKVGLTVAALGCVAYSLLGTSKRRFVRPILGTCGAVLGGIALWLWSTGQTTYLGDSGMRVLWQLLLATGAALTLLVGSILLFKQRAGVVTLHFGVGLLMFGGWFVSQYDVEEQMTLREGQTLNYGQDIRSVELAIVRRNSPEFPGKDDVIAIPLTRNGHPTSLLQTGTIADSLLPLEIEIVEYDKSSTVEMIRDQAPAPVDAGQNQGFRIVPAKPAAGAMGSSVDLASGYFRFKDPATQQTLGTYLLSQESLMMRDGMARNFDTETITVNGQKYDVQLRFVRNYKDYSLRLLKFDKDDYLGTSIAKNFASTVQLKDPIRQVNQDLKIWMNNPRRYAGETFYQSGWNQDSAGRKYTTLQVVRNRGWMIPYVACMVAVVGMFYHFVLMLLRFLDRQSRDAEGTSSALQEVSRRGSLSFRTRWVVPTLVGVGFALLFGRLALPPRTPANDLNLDEFGKLPLVYQGRVKPFDTLARNTMRVIADAETFRGILPPQELKAVWPQFVIELKQAYPAVAQEDLSKYESGDTNGLVRLIEEKTSGDRYAITSFVESRLFSRQPAVRWLLDAITGAESLRRHKVVRIYHPQVLDLLGLQRRKFYRYSLEEIMTKYAAFEEQVAQADRIRQADVEELSLYQKKILELDRKLSMIMALHRAFSPPQFPPLPTPEEFQGAHEGALQKLNEFRNAMLQQEEVFRRQPPPLAVAPQEKGDPWQAYAAAWPEQMWRLQLLGEQPQRSFQALNDIMLSYLDNDAEKFNRSVQNYQTLLDQKRPAELSTKPTFTSGLVNRWFGSFYRFESDFNRVSPLIVCAYLYVLAFVLACCGWLFWPQGMNLVTFWIIVCTFAIHTLALAARVYISGRPPVTNLYSSAVFIGWGIVLLALIIELVFRSGLASLIAAASGFITLLIAHKLAAEGDTFEVLQAVLDTQFWLATHVVCITLGYATTFLAGGLGLLYVVRGLATTTLNERTRSELARMIYGTLCFAIFFSFFGTVLGGLWADDSWGRFWGWDPKENGALIIVLWNALILHAKWDKLIRDRGLAVLAVAGNIVTAWSWFGVNELGVGLHSYGFTEGRLLTLGVAIAAHLLVVAAGCLPPQLWLSFRRSQAAGLVRAEG